jgi:hypothetical protein
MEFMILFAGMQNIANNEQRYIPEIPCQTARLPVCEYNA